MSDQDAYRRRQSERDAKRKKNIWQKLKNLNPDRVVQSLLVIFTFGIVAVGLLQWSTLDKTDTTLREGQRAFLLLKDVGFTYGDPINGASNRDFSVSFRNVGKHVSKVTKIEAGAVYGVIRKNLPDILADHKTLPSVVFVPPIAPDSDAMAFTHNKRAANPLIEDDALIKGLRDGSIPLWFYGFLEYETGYPSLDPGKLGFCMKYVPPGERRPGMGQFITCEYPQYTYTR